MTIGALQSSCQSDPCQNCYVAHVSTALDKLLYGTYLLGIVQATAQLYSDGSVYYAGTVGPGFPTTPTAYQRQNAGGNDGVIARLDPSGTKLLSPPISDPPRQTGFSAWRWRRMAAFGWT